MIFHSKSIKQNKDNKTSERHVLSVLPLQNYAAKQEI